MNPVAFVQARMGSTRLPGKVLTRLCGRSLLGHIVDRLRSVAPLAAVVVITSDQATDQPIHDFCDGEGIPCFQGSEQDVLDRFYQAARVYSADPVLRITGDCPFVDPRIVARLWELYSTGRFDHVGVATGAGAVASEACRYADGLDAECFAFAALATAWREAELPAFREHVTPFLWGNPDRFRLGSLYAPFDMSEHRWTVDTLEDLAFATRVYEALYREGGSFFTEDILELLKAKPELRLVNRASSNQGAYEGLLAEIAGFRADKENR